MAVHVSGCETCNNVSCLVVVQNTQKGVVKCLLDVKVANELTQEFNGGVIDMPRLRKGALCSSY